MERRAKLYGVMPHAQLDETPLDEEHEYQEEERLDEQGLEDAEYFEYVQWGDGETEEQIVQETPVGHAMMDGEQQQEGVDYGEEDFSEYVEFNDEEDAKRYMAKMEEGDLLEEEEMVEREEEGGEEEELMHAVELHDPDRNTMFQMYAAPTTRRQATIVECEMCGVVLKHPSKIRAHMRTHTGERPYECTHCGKTFTQRTPWRMHEKRHMQDLPYKCSYDCGKAFPNASQRNAHDLRHAGRLRMGPPRPHLKPKKRVVPIDVMVETHEAMMDDLRGPPIVDAPLFTQPAPLSAAAHKRLDEVICAVAENRPVRQIPRPRPSSPSSSAARRPSTKRAPPIVAQCQICGLMVKHPSKIQAHMRSHQGIKPWQCTLCGLSVASLYALRMHHRRKHVDGERPLSCTWECGRRFVSVSARNEHERIVHAGIKRYECSISGCRRLFSRRIHLVTHRIKDHPGLIHVDEFDDAVDLDYEMAASLIHPNGRMVEGGEEEGERHEVLDQPIHHPHEMEEEAEEEGGEGREEEREGEVIGDDDLPPIYSRSMGRKEEEGGGGGMYRGSQMRQPHHIIPSIMKRQRNRQM